MDIEIIRPGTKDELLVYLIDEDECRLIHTYRFHFPEDLPRYERIIAVRDSMPDWLYAAEIRAAIVEQWLLRKKKKKANDPLDRPWDKSWRVLARFNIDEMLQGLS